MKTNRSALVTGDTVIVEKTDGQLVTAEVTYVTLTYIYCDIYRFSVMSGEDRRSGYKLRLHSESINGQTFAALLASQANRKG